MSVSIEALAMAGVDHNQWGMDFEEWERMEMGPPPPHLYADDCEENEQGQDDRVEEVVVTPTNSVDRLCGFTVAGNQTRYVFDERNKDDHEDARMQSSKVINKFMKHHHAMKRFKMLVVVLVFIIHKKRESTCNHDLRHCRSLNCALEYFVFFYSLLFEY
ncbi:hypothetical protein LXL04_014138 [Taraxacum kok-saghyz]